MTPEIRSRPADAESFREIRNKSLKDGKSPLLVETNQITLSAYERRQRAD